MLSPHLRQNGVLKTTLNADQRGAYAAITDKITSGTYQWEAPQCPTCAGDTFSPLAEADRYGLPYTLVSCQSCGLFQVAPRLTEASLADFYAHHYRMLYGGVSDVAAVKSQAAEERGRVALNLVSAERTLLPGARVVEIGCGAGAQLRAFQTAGCDVVGYDYDETFMALGREAFDLDLREGGVQALAQDIAAGDPKADVVLYIHVLEHLSDPRRELRNLSEILAPGGVVYIEVPGLSSCLRNRECHFDHYFEFAHTYHFDKKTLADLVAACGWHCLWSDHYVRAVLTPQTATLPYLRAVTATIEASEQAQHTLTSEAIPLEPEFLLSALLRGGMTHDQAYFQVGEALFARQDTSAVTYLEKAHVLHPTRGKYAFLLARAMLTANIGTPAELLVVLQNAVRHLPDAPFPLFHMANTLEALGRSQEAVGAYAAALRLQPDNALFHYRLGLSHKSIGHWQGAIASFKEAQKYDPSLTYAYFHEGVSREQIADFTGAAEAFGKAYATRADDIFLAAQNRCLAKT